LLFSLLAHYFHSFEYMPEFFSGDWSKFSDDLENLFLFYVSLQHCIDSSSNVVIERVVVQFFSKISHIFPMSNHSVM